MSAGISSTPILLRREIEARIAGPLIESFITEFGEEPTMKIVEQVVLLEEWNSGVKATLMMLKRLNKVRKDCR